MAPRLRSAKDCGYQPVAGTPSPTPLEKPPFTLKQIRDAIPPHCFQRSLPKSLGYLLWDIVSCVSLMYLSTYIPYLPKYVSFFIWPIYWYVEGMYFGGPWIMGHECGHQAFSDYEWVNDTVGFLVHSSLLVPYFNWRTSHAKHHQYTSSCQDDEIYQPPTRSAVTSKLTEMIQDSPLYNLIGLFFMMTIGFIPFYLVYNAAGPTKYHGKNVNHFSPNCAIFLRKQWKAIILGDIGFFGMITVLIYASLHFGFSNLFFYYGMPYLVLNTHLMLITFLHHTDTYIPHYRGEEWTWLRGALCTVDRSYGPWLDNVSHQIATTHVVHHLFPAMPFYHALEATEAMKKVLGKYHLTDDTPIYKALWRAGTQCHFIEDEEKSSSGIVFWKKNIKAN